MCIAGVTTGCALSVDLGGDPGLIGCEGGVAVGVGTPWCGVSSADPMLAIP